MDNQETLSSQENLDITTVKKRAVRGVVVLTGRTFLLSVISLVATGFLTVFLEPGQFGVFWIVTAIVNFLAYFSDIGLAAALIQKKEAPEKKDLYTTFTIQLILVGIILLGLYVGNPAIQRIYGLTEEGRYLLYALGISLLFSSLKTIPSVLLERELEFSKLVLPQVIENVVYNVIAVFLAWKGFGISSFTYAVLARGVVGLIIIYILKPWRPSLGINRNSLKGLLSYGVPYQANTLLAMVKDDGMTVFLGTILGPSGIGFLGWAQKWGYAPLRFFMDHVVKVTFPAFARMQKEKDELKHSLERSIFFICFLVFPSLIGLLILSPLLVEIIPKYEKWTPALIPLYLIGINTVFAAVTTQLTNILSAIGKIKVTFKLMLMWTGITWLSVPFLAIKWGVVGAALGYSIVGSSSIIAMIVARRYVKYSLYTSFLKPFVSAVVMGVVVLFVRGKLPVVLNSVWILIGLGVIIYGISVYLLVGTSLIGDVKKSFKTLFS